MSRSARAARASLALAVSAVFSACSGDSERARPIPIPDPRGRGDAGQAEDVRVFVPPDAVPVRPPPSNCGGTQATLTRRRATVLFVVDRSGSMSDPTTDNIPKWAALLQALGTALPRVNADLAMGLLFFPEPYVVAMGQTATEGQICGVVSTPRVTPGAGNASAILGALQGTLPGGATPTAAGLNAAVAWLTRDPDRSGEQIIVLATDGGPNCNPDFDPAICACTGPAERLCRNNVYGRLNCLDADRTVAAVTTARAQGVSTIVLGLAGTQDFGAVLDQMAVAGGRPRAGAPRYYSVASASDLARELTALTSALAECRFALESAPPDANLVDVRLGGESLVRDDARNNGWAYSDDTHTVIEFFGNTCDRVRAASGGVQLSAAFGCPAPAPP